MKVAQLIEQRQGQWAQLDLLCGRIGKNRNAPAAEEIALFSKLYRAACADLALAEAYQFPPVTVDFLHQLVARAHNQLYRGRGYRWSQWMDVILFDTPQKIFKDRCVHVCFLIFWGMFLASAYLAFESAAWPNFASDILGAAGIEQLEQFADFEGRTFGQNASMFAFYIFNNAGIGLMCFATMILLLPGIVTLVTNAVHLGASFGYMFRADSGAAGDNFTNFVTAHAPLELTAIVLSAGAGMRLGISWLSTKGRTRRSSLQDAGKEALPIAMCAVVLFILAAIIEGFLSPTPATVMPWWVKGSVAVITSTMLMVYFVILGYPRGNRHAA